MAANECWCKWRFRQEGAPAEVLLTGVLHSAVLCHSSSGGARGRRAHCLAKVTVGAEHLTRALDYRLQRILHAEKNGILRLLSRPVI